MTVPLGHLERSPGLTAMSISHLIPAYLLLATCLPVVRAQTAAENGGVATPSKALWQTSEVQAPQLSFEVFYSRLADCNVSYHVYTPPHYTLRPQGRFPVLYWLHGTAGGVGGIRPVSRMFHLAMENDEIPPMIVVFVNGLPGHLWTDSKDGTRPVESVFVKELIPLIDKSMRTLPNREGRILEGFSMGGYGAARIGVKFSDLFGRISILAAGPLDLEFQGPRATGNPLRAEILQNVCSGDIEFFQQTHPRTVAKRHAEKLAKVKPKVRVAVGTEDDSAYLTKSFHKHLDELRIRHEYYEVPDAGHDAFALFTYLKSNSKFYRSDRKTDEQSHAKEPASGVDSDGELSAPAR